MTVIYRGTYVLIQFVPHYPIWDRYDASRIVHLNQIWTNLNHVRLRQNVMAHLWNLWASRPPYLYELEQHERQT